MNTTVMHDTLAASEAGQLTFPNVVKALTEVGVESYLIDLASGSATCDVPWQPERWRTGPISPAISYFVLARSVVLFVAPSPPAYFATPL